MRPDGFTYICGITGNTTVGLLDTDGNLVASFDSGAFVQSIDIDLDSDGNVLDVWTVGQSFDFNNPGNKVNLHRFDADLVQKTFDDVPGGDPWEVNVTGFANDHLFFITSGYRLGR